MKPISEEEKERRRELKEEISREEMHRILGFMAMFLTSALAIGFLLFVFKAVMA